MKKFFLAFFAVLAAIFTLSACDKKNTADSDGSIKVELVDLEGVKEEKQIDFKSGDTLLGLLEANYQNVKVEGSALMSIENLYTASNWNPYIAIYVDGKYGSYGIDAQPIYDGLVLTLRMECFE